jgi:hypothetical protein
VVREVHSRDVRLGLSRNPTPFLKILDKAIRNYVNFIIPNFGNIVLYTLRLVAYVVVVNKEHV